jgi:hypothetical protein
LSIEMHYQKRFPARFAGLNSGLRKTNKWEQLLHPVSIIVL